MSSRKDIRPPSQKTSKSTKENRESKDGKGGKDTQDDKGGKDHHSSLPSRSRPRQAGFITPAHHQRSVPVPHGARGQSVDLIKYSRDRWNREGEQRVTLDPHEELPEQKGKMEVEGVQGCKASSQVGRKDRLGSG